MMATRPDVRAAQTGQILAAEVPAPRSPRRARPSGLDGGERLQVLETLIAVLGGAYAHLPAKRAAYAVNPVQALTLLARRATDLSDTAFHLEVTSIVTGLRDGHTRYIGPASLHGRVAALPFLVEQHGSYADPHFLVTKTVPEIVGDPAFEEGVRLERLNAIPVARAVDLYADRETGGRPDARRARALESFTFRALDYGPPPDEQEVLVDYRSLSGQPRRVLLPWRVLAPRRAATALRPGAHGQLKVAADQAAEAVRRAKKLLFSPEMWRLDSNPGAAAPSRLPHGVAEAISTTFQDNVTAYVREDGFGYLRLWSFDVQDDDAFVTEVARLLGLLPSKGLVVDLRGNPGGLVWAAERLLQLFTDTAILPTRFSLLASPLTRAMAQSPFNQLELGAWAASLDQAVSTGEQYSQPLPLTDPQWCTGLPRAYAGPAVAVVDANTYSSGDLFTAGWVDHRIGPLVTVGQATGAGGANVWTSAQLRDALLGTEHAFAPLPEGCGFTLSIRRAIRSGVADGIPIEDLGIGGVPYDMTRNDLLHGNRDLLAFCTDLLT